MGMYCTLVASSGGTWWKWSGGQKCPSLDEHV